MTFIKCLPGLLLLLSIHGGEACNNWGTSDYRNFWLELSSTTPCGHPGASPVGVCALAATCSIMGGESQGTYNCPLTRATCCRPVARCNATSIALNLLWQSPEYDLKSQLSPSECQLRVIPSPDTCYIRVDFDDMDLEAKDVDRCSSSKLTIKGQEQGDGNVICGTLNHKTTFVKVGTNVVGLRRPINLELKMDHTPHQYSVRINHIKCTDVQSFNHKVRQASARAAKAAKPTKNLAQKDPGYMARLFAVAYTDKPLIRSCPVTFIAKDIVIGSAACGLRLGGPGTSKGLMVVHGASHTGDRSTYPSTVSAMAKYVAANGVVVKATTFHPMYNHVTHEHDLAIYFLNKTVASADPVELAKSEQSFKNLGVSVSRYHYFEMADDVTVLAQAEERDTKVVDSSECVKSDLPKISAVSNNQTLCLMAIPRDDVPCSGRNGDAGSPIIHVGSSGTVTLLGLLMGGYHPCDGRKMNYPEPALNINDYADFIDVSTSPAYKIPLDDGATVLTPVVNWYNSLFNNSPSDES